MLTESQRERIKADAVEAATALSCPTCGSHVHMLETGPLGRKYRCASWCQRPIFILCWPSAKAKEFHRARRAQAERIAENAIAEREAEHRFAQPRHRFMGNH